MKLPPLAHFVSYKNCGLALSVSNGAHTPDKSLKSVPIAWARVNARIGSNTSSPYNYHMSFRVKTTLLLLAILVVASFFRFYHFTSTPPGLYLDEAMNGNDAWAATHDHSTDGGFHVWYPGPDGYAGLYINTQAFILNALVPPSGLPEPWMVRILSAVVGVLTVLGVFLLTQELVGFSEDSRVRVATALIASFFVATSVWHINFSRIAFSGITEPFCFVFAIYFLLRGLRLSAERWTHHGILSLIVAGIIYAAGFYTYLSYRITPLIVLAFFVWLLWYAKEKRKKNLQAFSIFFGTILCAVLPLVLFFVTNPTDLFDRYRELSIFALPHPIFNTLYNIAVTIRMFNFMGDTNWRHNLSGAPMLFWPIGILFCFGVWHAIVSLRKKSEYEGLEPFRKDAAVLLLAWLCFGIIPGAFSNEGVPHALRGILLIPPAYILAAWLNVLLYRKLYLHFDQYKRAVLNATVMVMVIAVVLNAYLQYFVIWANSPEVPASFSTSSVALARTVNTLPADMEKYLIVTPNGTGWARQISVSMGTVQFLTDSFVVADSEARHIHYILPDQASVAPAGSFVATIPSE